MTPLLETLGGLVAGCTEGRPLFHLDDLQENGWIVPDSSSGWCVTEEGLKVFHAQKVYIDELRGVEDPS